MKFTIFPFFYFIVFSISSLFAEEGFIANRRGLRSYYEKDHIVMIASPGRSGSTMLRDAAKKYAANYAVLKTHLLPPDARFKGKIVFIFSNPDKAAESALHVLLNSRSGGKTHFSHVESADQSWFDHIGRNGDNQSKRENLLAYDALGCATQLEQWLHVKTLPSSRKEAQILAIKYEHLWEEETVNAIRRFLRLKVFELPPKQERGQEEKELSKKEKYLKKIYNKGTEDHPIYPAYDHARELWEQAPPYQYLKLVE